MKFMGLQSHQEPAAEPDPAQASDDLREAAEQAAQEAAEASGGLGGFKTAFDQMILGRVYKCNMISLDALEPLGWILFRFG